MIGCCISMFIKTLVKGENALGAIDGWVVYLDHDRDFIDDDWW